MSSPPERSAEAIEPATLLRNFMRLLIQPVAVVTSRKEEVNFGLTVSSFTSVSLKPPLILLCVDNNAPSLSSLVEKGEFVLNLLRREQTELSDIFAGRRRTKNKFETVQFSLGQESNMPILHGTIGYLECKIREKFNGGDHVILMSEIVGGATTTGSPLLYHDQSYGTQRYSCPTCERPFAAFPE